MRPHLCSIIYVGILTSKRPVGSAAKGEDSMFTKRLKLAPFTAVHMALRWPRKAPSRFPVSRNGKIVAFSPFELWCIHPVCVETATLVEAVWYERERTEIEGRLVLLYCTGMKFSSDDRSWKPDSPSRSGSVQRLCSLRVLPAIPRGRRHVHHLVCGRIVRGIYKQTMCLNFAVEDGGREACRGLHSSRVNRASSLGVRAVSCTLYVG